MIIDTVRWRGQKVKANKMKILTKQRNEGGGKEGAVRTVALEFDVMANLKWLKVQAFPGNNSVSQEFMVRILRTIRTLFAVHPLLVSLLLSKKP